MRLQLLKYLSILSLFILGCAQLQAAAPRNDAQSEAFRIFEACYVVGDNSEATHEPDELDHASAGGSKSLWWSWSPNASGETTLTLRPYGGASEFVLSVYREEFDGELVEVALINPLTHPEQHFTAQFEVQSGEQYVVAVDSPSGSLGGRFYMGLNQAPEFLTPLQVRVLVGEPFEIPINVAGAPSEVSLEGGLESVSYDSSSRMLRGTFPDDQPWHHATLRAVNSHGERSVEIALIPEREEAIFTGAASAVGFVGVPFEYVLSFEGDPQLTSQDIHAYQLPQGFYLVKEVGQWKIKGLADQSHDSIMRIDIQVPEGQDLYLEIPLLIVTTADANLQPAIISPLMVRGVVGQPFIYQIETSLPGINGYSASPLPNGLTFNEETGIISGILENGGNQIVKLIASFNYSPYATKAELSVQILEESAFAPVIQSSATAVAWVGVPFEYQIEATNGVDSYSMHSGLPQGLILNQATGLISGTPVWPTENEQLHIRAQNQRDSAEAIVTLDILWPVYIAHVTSPAQVSAVVGEFFEYQIETNLEAFESHEMSAHHLPEGLEYDELTGRIFGVPQQVGNENVIIQFFDNNIEVQLQVVENQNPVEFLNAATAVGRVGSFFYFAMNAQGAVRFSAEPPVDGLTFSSHTGVFTGVPTAAGTYQVRVHGYSEQGDPTHTELQIVIMEAAEVVPPPMILSPGQLLAEVGETFAYSISSSKYGNDNFDAWSLPEGVFFDQASGTLFGSVDQPSHAVVRIFAGAASADLHMHFYEPAERPLLVSSAPSAVGRKGELFEYQIETDAAEVGAEDLYFQAGGDFPQSWTLDEHTGLIRGYLNNQDQLPFDFEVYVDVSGEYTEFTLTVVDGSTDVPPQLISAAHVVAYSNQAFEYQFVFDQSDVTLDISNLEEGLSYNASTQTLSGALSYENEFVVYFDRYEGSSSRWYQGQLTLEVRGFHERPIPLMISAAGAVANRGEFFSYDVEFNQMGVEWSLDHGPEWLVKSGNQLVGTVPEDESRYTEEVHFIYEQSGGNRNNATFELYYNSPEWPVAVVSPASAHATVGVEFSYQIEIEGDYGQINPYDLPVWASYDPVSMRVTGVPDSRGLETLNIELYSDGDLFYAQFQVMVEEAWQPAVVTSLQPQPVFEGVPYDYQLVIDGPFDTLDYNGPSWLELDPETLLLSGVPDNSGGDWLDVQVHNQIEHTQAHTELFGSDHVAPFILEELQDLVIYPGGRAYFIPEVAPGSLNHEWFKDGVSHDWYGDWLEFNDVTIDDQGAYSVRLDNGFAEAWTLPVELSVGQPSAYRDWLIAHVGWEIDDPSFSESDLSFAGDSTPDLMKWAFGIDPTSVLAEPLAESSMGIDGFEIQFNRSIAPRDVRILVERSETLGADDWDAIAILPTSGSWHVQLPNVTVDEVGTGELRSVTVVDSGEFSQYFVRVRIEFVPKGE